MLRPGSWLSLCSEPGISWVIERTGVPDFLNSAQKLTTAWSVRWKLRENNRQRGDYELDAATASQYSDAYFENCFESIYGVVYRPDFQARLRTYLEQGNLSSNDDAAWYALRNTVYAAGCRQVLLKNHATPYADAQAQAWRLFENALSVHTELLYAPSGLQAVQALAAMTFYAESLGNQGFEYMMCANAARLAQAKGLHRHPTKALALSGLEVAHRNWLFWAIYCCEKQIAFRSGRPSAIDDDNISCEIPVWAPASSTINVEVFTHMIKHARLTAQFEKRLMSVNAFRKSPIELLEASRDLSQQLEDWRNTITQFHAPWTRIQINSLPPNVRPLHIVYLHFAYYSSLMNIYAIYASPWISASLGIDRSPSFSEDAVVRSIAVADAARNIILITKGMEVDAAVPQWAAFYYPMAGLINLFMVILNFPTLPSAQADVALLDVAAGHFSHMEFLTSSRLAFPFTREIAALARTTVDKVKRGNGSLTIPQETEQGRYDLEQAALFKAKPFQAENFDLEGWNIFSSWFIDGQMISNDLADFVVSEGLPPA